MHIKYSILHATLKNRSLEVSNVKYTCFCSVKGDRLSMIFFYHTKNGLDNSTIYYQNWGLNLKFFSGKSSVIIGSVH